MCFKIFARARYQKEIAKFSAPKMFWRIGDMEVKNRRPNRGVNGGVNTFPKIICTTCRTVLIQNALCSPDLGRYSRYPEHVYNMRRNFSRGLWSSRVCSKKGVNEACQRSFEVRFYMNFWKIQNFFCLLQNNMHRVSYGPDSKCAVFPWSRRMF